MSETLFITYSSIPSTDRQKNPFNSNFSSTRNFTMDQKVLPTCMSTFVLGSNLNL
jgi:hypothetical protein